MVATLLILLILAVGVAVGRELVNRVLVKALVGRANELQADLDRARDELDRERQNSTLSLEGLARSTSERAASLVLEAVRSRDADMTATVGSFIKALVQRERDAQRERGHLLKAAGDERALLLDRITHAAGAGRLLSSTDDDGADDVELDHTPPIRAAVERQSEEDERDMLRARAQHEDRIMAAAARLDATERMDFLEELSRLPSVEMVLERVRIVEQETAPQFEPDEEESEANE
jgi:hypothetical protein